MCVCVCVCVLFYVDTSAARHIVPTEAYDNMPFISRACHLWDIDMQDPARQGTHACIYIYMDIYAYIHIYICMYVYIYMVMYASRE